MARDLFIDMTNRRLATSLTNLTPSAPPRFVKGDNSTINLYFLEATNNLANPFNVVDMTGTDVKFGVGTRTGLPTGGTFTLSYSGDTSSAIGYSATAGAISSALNSLSSIISAGGVSVDGSIGSNFVVSFNSTGSRSVISSDVSHLIPSVQSYIDRRIVGNSTTSEVQEIQLRLDPVAMQTTWTDEPTAVTASTSMVITGNAFANSVQKISFSKIPVQGSFSITVPTYSVGIHSILTSGMIYSTSNHSFALNQPITLTGFSAISGYTQGVQYYIYNTPTITSFMLSQIPNSGTGGAGLISGGSATTSGSSVAITIQRQTTPIQAGASASDVNNALNEVDAIGSFNSSVEKINDFFNITFINEKSAFNMPLLQVASSLFANPTKSASVDFNTFGVRDYLENNTSASADLEIELTTGGERNTIVLQPCTLAEELISQGGIN